jgi:hypothetical protein
LFSRVVVRCLCFYFFGFGSVLLLFQSYLLFSGVFKVLSYFLYVSSDIGYELSLLIR